MSAKGRGSEVEPFERYITPQWCVDAIFDIYDPSGLSVLEPGCDDAPYLKRAKELGAETTVGVDVRPVDVQPWVDILSVLDFTDANAVTSALTDRFDMIVMNPPFSLATQFVERALKLIKPYGYVIVLHRINWLASKGRGIKFWPKGHLRKVHVLSERPRFKDGTSGDATEYGYFVFNNECFTKFEGSWIFPK